MGLKNMFFKSLLLLFISINIYSQNLVINEILASNITTNTDQDNSYNDWVEIYNIGSSDVNLKGYGLSDDSEELDKWLFPSLVIKPGSYLLVWCSSKDTTENELHTNFKISASGENIYLTDTSRTIIDSFSETIMEDDVSYARVPNGSGNFVRSVPSPKIINTQTYADGVVDDPIFSHNPGFYTTDILLKITAPDPDATIIYTLDGSNPDIDNLAGTTYQYKNQYAELASQANGPLLNNTYTTLTYTGAITIKDRTSDANKLAAISSTYQFDPHDDPNIDCDYSDPAGDCYNYIPPTNIFKATVVKAQAIKGDVSSEIVTQTYFITPEGKSKYELPVVSLSINEDVLYDYTDGIYVAGKTFDDWRAANPTEDASSLDADANYGLEGRESEREAHFNYFVNGKEVISQNIGIRVNGGTTRALPNKSIRLVARDEYGVGQLEYPFFTDYNTSVFERMLLRNSGNDSRTTMYRDAFLQKLVAGFGTLETTAYQPTITFINGEFWGILNLRERYDDNYFKNVYGIDEIDLMKNNIRTTSDAIEGDNVFYKGVHDYLNANDLVNDENYEHVQTLIDIENMRDYYISNIYFSNTDWPGWNSVFWRKRTNGYISNVAPEHDGRLRAAIHDTDQGFGFGVGETSHNTLEFATATDGNSYPNPAYATLILRSLLDNESFKNNFINRFSDLLNTYFSPSRVVAVSNEMSAIIDPYVDEHLARWYSPFASRSWWEYSVGLLSDYVEGDGDNSSDFEISRNVHQRDHIRDKFGITKDDIDVTVDVDDDTTGYVTVSTIDIVGTTPGIDTNPYPWTGTYFSEIPLTVKAEAEKGYVFSHWSGDSFSTDEEIEITSEFDVSLTANFIEDPDAETPNFIYYWMINGDIENDTPLQVLNPTYSQKTGASIRFNSSLTGYPFTETDVNWRKASMERKSEPTDLNYHDVLNKGIVFEDSNMKGIQIKQPFSANDNENELIFNVPTNGFEDVKLSFAALNDDAVDSFKVSYALNSGEPIWTTNALPDYEFDLEDSYKLYTVDFSDIEEVENNASFKIKISFMDDDLTEDLGNRVVFNNIGLEGVAIDLDAEQTTKLNIRAYPNPTTDVLYISSDYQGVSYRIFTINGVEVDNGSLETPQIGVSQLSSGMYFLHLIHEENVQVIKIIKK
ncbi:CotH kinase family protein [Flavobacteriaceae bacterium]|nr:CotH kinase family protein [Flavobacteriaceae bacterium]